MKRHFLLLIAFSLLPACVTISSITTPNREGLLKLSVGMSKQEALSIMPQGKRTPACYVYIFPPCWFLRGPTINNPYRSEILQSKDKLLEVVYYVTDTKSQDGVITDDELTPLVFDDGKLIGWGENFLRDKVQKFEIRLR